MNTCAHVARTVIIVFAACSVYASDATAANDKSRGTITQRDNPVEKVVGDIENDYKGAEARHEDIFDRAFALLDHAVSDINRDLNDGSSDSTVPQTSD